MIFLICYFTLFITKQFPDSKIPYACWHERNSLIRNLWKLSVQVPNLLSTGYVAVGNAISLAVSFYILYERYVRPQMYNRYVHLATTLLETQLFVFSLFCFICSISSFVGQSTLLIYVVLIGVFLGFLIICAIDKKEVEVVSMGNDLKAFQSQFQIELYVVVMLHELQRLVQNEEYGQEKHIHAIISRHMEECQIESCCCKNYEPEYDKKFTTVGSKRLTKSYSQGVSGSLNPGMSLNELKKLPYKVTYKTKVEIFKQEFSTRVDKFLEEYPKSYGLKLLKSFFHHEYCEGSFKALFVQLENASTCKNFQGRIFIYHLKTQIQNEMKKSLESPLSININSLLKFEKSKIDFERYLEDLSFQCQTFWTDLIKEEYQVEQTLKTAYTVADYIMSIKLIFNKLISINPSCIDTSSTYALVYRYVLRDEATFSDLINRIQQIKNSSKLEYQREIGVKFFDADVYSLLLVSGDVKELGRIRQATSSSKLVFGYDPRDLIGSKINKLMPLPFSQIHDKFMNSFLQKGKSTFLEKNNPLPVITKDGTLSMTLFYIKPMVSLHLGLIFTCFAKLLNKYKIADDSVEYGKMSRVCVMLTDADGLIHGMNDNCSKIIGMPPTSARTQLSINDNQLFNISQICGKAIMQEYEFELVKGCQLQIDTSFLSRERQYRREYPDLACKIGVYKAEVGIHKFNYRDLKTEISIFVFKVFETDALAQHRTNVLNESSKSKEDEEDELTYSMFSITTANSSVASSQIATSKFKTFKHKIQSMETPVQIKQFQRIAIITFLMFLSITGGNFATNLLQNKNYMTNLKVMNTLQILIQSIPEAAHAARELVLNANGLVQTGIDVVLGGDKYQYYSNILGAFSNEFEQIQEQIQTTYKSKLQFSSYMIQLKDLQADGSINLQNYSAQTCINLFSSLVLKLSTISQNQLVNVSVPLLSFDWNSSNKNVSEIQQDLHFVIENGLNSIVQGLIDIQVQTEQEIDDSSIQAATIAIVLAAISIFLVVILLPLIWPTLIHIERISYLILVSLNRLPEAFCVGENKACNEIIMFLNEFKEGEKSTHQMIKKHTHRKQNRQILKLPKQVREDEKKSVESSNYESEDDGDKNSLVRKRGTQSRGSAVGESASIYSKGTESVSSSHFTSLAKLKHSQNQYESQQQSQLQRVKRNEGGGIELDFGHAKTSELLDEELNAEEDKEISESEIKQKEREKGRKVLIEKLMKKKKLKKCGYLLVIAGAIAVYFSIASYYLYQVHDFERHYSKDFQVYGDRIQCYTNAVSYVMDTLARGKSMSMLNSSDIAGDMLGDCFDQETTYLSMITHSVMRYEQIQGEYRSLHHQFDGSTICSTLQTYSTMNNLNITLASCSSVMNGIMNLGLTQVLFQVLRELQATLRQFDNRVFSNASIPLQFQIIKNVLKSSSNTNQLVSLKNIYLSASFNYMREEVLKIIENFFVQLNSYYNMLFGIFVSLLSLFQLAVSIYMVKMLAGEIVKMYHVVLLIPFSGRTQNDLNRLMMIKL